MNIINKLELTDFIFNDKFELSAFITYLFNKVE